MSLVVQKFGGSSVATAERITRAARRAIRAKQAGHQVIVVVSARGDTTDELIALAREITDRPPAREMDMLLATGEQVSIALMAMAIQTLGHPAVSFTGAQIGIVTDSFHTKARIKNISTQRIRQALDEGKIVIVAGFQGMDEHYNITTLGRGGSDTTAVALAAVMKHAESGVRGQGSGVRGEPGASATGEGVGTQHSALSTQHSALAEEVGCEIYTDVDGVYTADPRLVPQARKIDAISYDEMLELASVGAGVMHSRSIEFAKKFDVPIHVRSSFSDAEGTWIVPEADWMHDIAVCGSAIVRDEARVVLDEAPNRPGIGFRIFSAIAEQNIVLDMIAQSPGYGGRKALGFTVTHQELPLTLAVLRPLAAEWGAILRSEEEVSKVSVVGIGMRTRAGVAERMFAALAAENINIKMITTSDIKISVLVDKADGIRALQAVHQAFELHQEREVRSQKSVVRSRKPESPTEAALSTPTPIARAPGSPHSALSTQHSALSTASSSLEDIVVSDVQLDATQGRITIFDLPDRPGVCLRLFQAVASAGVVVDLIVQNLPAPGRAELSFSVPSDDLERAKAVTEQVVQALDPKTRVMADPHIAKLAVYGVGMRTHTGVVRRMCDVLSKHGININMFNTSEVQVSVVVDRARGEEALACLREAFTIG